MNVLILTNYRHEDFVYSVLDKLGYRGGLIVVINNKGDFEKLTSSFSYDIGISFMYQYKVPKEQIDHRPWINFHPAPLPEYKGRNLCYHAIMNGEKEFGATVHYMDENFDTGDIIEVMKFELWETETAEELSRLAIEASKTLFKKYLPRILDGEVFSTTKNVGGTYYKKEPIPEYFFLSEEQQTFVRAVTYKDFCPKTEIGGVTYKIVREK